MYESEKAREVEMPWVYNDAGYAGRTTARGRQIHGNGVVRAIAIATGQRYMDVHIALYREQCEFVNRSRSQRVQDKGASIEAAGVWPEVSKKYLLDHGWEWVPVMKVGSGVTVHLSYEEVPDLPLFIARVSRNLVTVIHGVAQDISDPSRAGTRALYGYFAPSSKS
jgi:hypothetical protein